MLFCAEFCVSWCVFMCTGAPDCETMNRLNKIEDGPEGETPSFVSPTSGSTTEVKPVLSLSTSPDSRQSE